MISFIHDSPRLVGSSRQLSCWFYHHFNVSSQWYISRVQFWAHISSSMVFPLPFVVIVLCSLYVPTVPPNCSLFPTVQCSQLFPQLFPVRLCVCSFPSLKNRAELLINNQWMANDIPGFLIKPRGPLGFAYTLMQIVKLKQLVGYFSFCSRWSKWV